MENTIQVIYPHTSMHGHLQLSADIAPKMTKDRIIIDSMGNYIKLCITSDEIPQNRGMVIVVRFMVAKEHDFGTELLWTVVDQGSDPHFFQNFGKSDHTNLRVKAPTEVCMQESNIPADCFVFAQIEVFYYNPRKENMEFFDSLTSNGFKVCSKICGPQRRKVTFRRDQSRVRPRTRLRSLSPSRTSGSGSSYDSDSDSEY